MTSINYNLLFSIELLHKFFANGRCNDFTITPSAQTSDLLQGYKIVAKQNGNQLYVGIGTDASGNVSIVPADGTRFTFYLQLNNPLFWNYTNLPSLFPQNSVYYFTNRINNKSNGKNFLSLPTLYNSATTYAPDDVAIDPAGTVFRALHTLTNITPVAGNDWMEIDANRYLSNNDLLPLLPSVSTYTFSSPQTSATVQVHGFDATTKDYTALVHNQTFSFASAVSSFSLNLASLPPGKYKVKVNSDAEQTVYINDELQMAQAFAVIDLYNESTLPDGYKILNGTKLLSPLYSLQFLNRATIWKYSFTSANATVSDHANVYHFSAPAPHTVLSLSPIPLSETPLNLQLNAGVLEYTPIACPSPQRVTKISAGIEVYNCSEIFINY